jgi:hypothetical protein
MKLLLDGKQRSIYFQKDNTAYYKSGGSKTDITHIFKKTGGGLKKKYSNLLIENEDNILNKNNRKLILGGTLEIDPFADIVISNDNDQLFYKKIHQIFLLAKIQHDLGILDLKNEFKNLLFDIAVKQYDPKKLIKKKTGFLNDITYLTIAEKLDDTGSKFNSDITPLNTYVKTFLEAT